MVLIKYKESPFVQSFYSSFLREWENKKKGLLHFHLFIPLSSYRYWGKKVIKKRKDSTKGDTIGFINGIDKGNKV